MLVGHFAIALSILASLPWYCQLYIIYVYVVNVDNIAKYVWFLPRQAVQLY